MTSKKIALTFFFIIALLIVLFLIPACDRITADTPMDLTAPSVTTDSTHEVTSRTLDESPEQDVNSQTDPVTSDEQTFLPDGETGSTNRDPLSALAVRITLDAAEGTLDEDIVKELVFNNSFVLPIPSREGYTFDGWYCDEKRITDEKGVSIIIWEYRDDKTLSAHWQPKKYRIEMNVNDSRAGSILGDGYYDCGSSVTISATKNIGYRWLGWYEAERKVSDNYSFTFDMPAKDVTYTAAFELCVDHAIGEKCVCIKCGVVEHSFPEDDCACTKCGTIEHIPDDRMEHWEMCVKCGFRRYDDEMYFGNYPGSRVTDIELTEALSVLAGKLPTENDNGGWTSYKYYLNQNNATDFMWYIDLSYEGEKYRGVYFTEYRQGSSRQEKYGYTPGDIYWFLFAPIRWRVLYEEGNEVLIYSMSIIDTQAYNDLNQDQIIDGQTIHVNNYAYSSIRNWLNDTFYNTAFSGWQKDAILLTTVDNSESSTHSPNDGVFFWDDGIEINTYVCEDTEDHIFLLSEQEVNTRTYGFSVGALIWAAERRMLGTDYALCQGLDQETNIQGSDYNGKTLGDHGDWWLRSPSGNYPNYAKIVNKYGNANEYRRAFELYGVVPALRVTLQ